MPKSLPGKQKVEGSVLFIDVFFAHFSYLNTFYPLFSPNYTFFYPSIPLITRNDTSDPTLVKSTTTQSPSMLYKVKNQYAFIILVLNLMLVVTRPLASASSLPHVAVIGGGPSGYFAAITLASLAPSVKVTVLEATSKPLNKVLISGGGRCNLLPDTSLDTRTRILPNYPRGQKELLGPMLAAIEPRRLRARPPLAGLLDAAADGDDAFQSSESPPPSISSCQFPLFIA